MKLISQTDSYEENMQGVPTFRICEKSDMLSQLGRKRKNKSRN